MHAVTVTTGSIRGVKTSSSTPEFARFNEALRRVMTVTKPEMTALLHDDKALEGVRQRKGPKPKISASARASRDKG
jgi:hypothetical protein